MPFHSLWASHAIPDKPSKLFLARAKGIILVHLRLTELQARKAVAKLGVDPFFTKPDASKTTVFCHPAGTKNKVLLVPLTSAPTPKAAAVGV
jgi:hypothetical protein